MIDEPWELPRAWRWARFDEVARVASNLVDRAGYADAPHIAPNHIESETGRLLPYATILADGVTSSKHHFFAGQVLYSKIRPYLAKVVVADFEGLCSADMYPVESELDPRFLKWWMLTREFTRRAAGEQARTVLPKINVRALSALPVPVPPADEQRRIVEVLEDRLSRLDAALANLTSCQVRADAWRRSSIDATVWGNEEAPRVAVAQLLAEKMRNGHSARVSKVGTGVRTLTLTAVTRNSFSDAFTKIGAVEAGRIRDLWLRDGDILVQRSNTPELVGTTAIYRGPHDWAIFPDLLIRLRANASRVSPAYLAAAMRTERAHRQLRDQAKGLAGSMPKIDQSAIGSLLIPIPSAETQDAVTSRVVEIEDEYVRLTIGIRLATRRLQSLRRALLAAAFSGRLTGSAT